MKQIESYHISKSEYGIITLIINTKDKWLNYSHGNYYEFYRINFYRDEEDIKRIEEDEIKIPLREFSFDLEKEGRYHRLEQQEKDQIIFYWIPIRLLKGDEYVEHLKKRKEMTIQQIIEACINKELEPYGVTYEQVKKGGEKETINIGVIEKKKYFFGLFTKTYWKSFKKPWYQAYTFNSKEEYESWKEFCINLFRKEMKMSKKAAEAEFSWFNLNYGLKQNYNTDDTTRIYDRM